MRTFWLGLGAGILVATLAIGAGETLQGKGPVSEPKMVSTKIGSTQSMSAPADWKQEAQKAGMLVLSQADLNQRLAAAKSDGAQQKAAELAAQKQATQSAPTKVEVYIQPGLGTAAIAQLLQAAGVLTDGNELIALREKSPNPLRAGIFDLPLQSDAATIFKMLTNSSKQ